MTPPLWDPRDVLQLPLHYSGVHCVGRTQIADGKCTLRPPSSYRSGIQPLLTSMSQTDPKSVTSVMLYQLARCYLCATHYRVQNHQVVGRWKHALDAATRHNRSPERSTVSNDGSASGQVEELQADVDYWKDEAWQLQKTKWDQEDIIKELRRSQQTLEDKIQGISLAQKISEDLQVATKAELNHANKQLRTFQARLKEAQDQSDAFRVQVEELREEKSSAREEVEELRAEVDVRRAQAERMALDLEDEKGFARRQIDELRMELEASKMEAERTTVEFQGKESSLQQALTALEDERTRRLSLEQQMQSMKVLQQSLLKSMQNCWLHRLRAWIAEIEASIRQWWAARVRKPQIRGMVFLGVGLGATRNFALFGVWTGSVMDETVSRPRVAWWVWSLTLNSSAAPC